jgi:Na+(H+)/acetate symporter ActP
VVIGGLLSGCLAAGSGLLLAASATARRLGAGPFGTWVATTAAAAGLAVAWRGIGLVTVVGWGFAFAAATLSPVVLAGLWWRPASPEGVRWGAATGAALTACSIAAVWAGAAPSGWQPLVAAPGLASIPAALSATALRSLGSPARRTRDPRVAARLRFHRPGRRRARA